MGVPTDPCGSLFCPRTWGDLVTPWHIFRDRGAFDLSHCLPPWTHFRLVLCVGAWTARPFDLDNYTSTNCLCPATATGKEGAQRAPSALRAALRPHPALEVFLCHLW